MKDDNITIRISKQDKISMKKDAEDNGQSIAGMIIWLWKEYHHQKILRKLPETGRPD